MFPECHQKRRMQPPETLSAWANMESERQQSKRFAGPDLPRAIYQLWSGWRSILPYCPASNWSGEVNKNTCTKSSIHGDMLSGVARGERSSDAHTQGNSKRKRHTIDRRLLCTIDTDTCAMTSVIFLNCWMSCLPLVESYAALSTFCWGRQTPCAAANTLAYAFCCNTNMHGEERRSLSTCLGK